MTVSEAAGQPVRVLALVPAAGSGQRLGDPLPKALVRLGGVPLVARAVSGLALEPRVAAIVVIAPPGAVELAAEAVGSAGARADVTIRVVPGGSSRVASVRAGLAAAAELGKFDVVLVHDAARCLTPVEVVGRVIDAVVAGAAGVVPVLPVTDTIRQVDPAGGSRTLERSALRSVQTPQGFAPEELLRAHALESEGATDDAGLIEALDLPVAVVPGDPRAFKVTTRLDLLLGEAIIATDAGLAGEVS